MINKEFQSYGNITECVPSLRALSFFLVGNQDRADDLVEESINRLFVSRLSSALEIKLKVRMFAILHTLYCTGRDKNEARTGRKHSETLAASPLQQNAVVSGEFHSAFWRLHDYEREALILVEASGLSCQEVALVCGSTASMIKMRASRAHQKLERESAFS